MLTEENTRQLHNCLGSTGYRNSTVTQLEEAQCNEAYGKTIEQLKARSFIGEAYGTLWRETPAGLREIGASGVLGLLAVLLAPSLLYACLTGIWLGARRVIGLGNARLQSRFKLTHCRSLEGHESSVLRPGENLKA